MRKNRLILTALATYCTINFATAHEGNSNLHVTTKWKDCSIQLDPSLTQQAWHQFAREAGLVTYFRSVTDAKPMGVKRFEVSILQWNTAINEHDDAWNNTFVHPNSEHELIGGNILPFPGISIRAGISRKVDVAVYWTQRFGANFGLAGAQVQYNFINDTVRNWSLSTRANFNYLYGPADLYFGVCGLDVLASKKFRTFADWASVSPYAGLSNYFVAAHERTDAVNLKDEYISGNQFLLGAVVQLSIVRLGVEYNFAKTNTLSYKFGVRFKL